MKVYIVVDSPSGEQSTILAVCSTLEIAKEYISANVNKSYQVYNDVDTEEWEVTE